MITLEDIERLAPLVAFGALVWKGSAIVGELRSSIAANTTATNMLRAELTTHGEWRTEVDDKIATIEKDIAVLTAVDDGEKRRIEERIESLKGRRAVRATEHQIIDNAAIAARKRRKKP